MTVTRCTFDSNEGRTGAGAINHNATGTFRDCLFIDNVGSPTSGGGGGIVEATRAPGGDADAPTSVPAVSALALDDYDELPAAHIVAANDSTPRKTQP